MSRNIDLNLFRVFEAIMRHRSVSAAGRDLGLTSSAVSHALARLRAALDDDLFVPGPAGMEPTRRSLELAPRVAFGLQHLAGAVEATAFTPRDCVRSFGIAVSDYTASAVIPPLVASLARQAPTVMLRAFPANRTDVVRSLDEGRIDLVLGWFDRIPERLRRRTVTTEQEALIVRAGHPLTVGRLTVDRLLGFPHAVVELTGGEDHLADGFFDERGVRRRTWAERLLLEAGSDGRPTPHIVVTVPSYGPVPLIVERTDFVATLPRRLALQAARHGAVVLLDLPYDPLDINIEAVWHGRLDRDPGLHWLLTEIVAVMNAADESPGIRPG